jgi:hypothetical protein
MKHRVFCAAVVCLTLAVFAQDSPTAGFRGFQWGAPPADIKTGEKAILINETTSPEGLFVLQYQGNIGDLGAIFTYCFAESRFVEGRYLITEDHENQNLFIGDFERVDSSLSEKYGKSTKLTTAWSNKLYKDDPDEWGLAVSIGHLVYQTEWAQPGMKIIHQLRGDNFKVLHLLYYTSTDPAHQKLVEDAAKKAKANVL